MPTTSVVFSPELDERALDREVRQTNDAFADAASDLDVGISGGAGGGRVGGGGIANRENAMLGLAEQRNELLEDIHETLDEDFVGSSSGGGGGGGVGGIGTTLGIGAIVSAIPSAGAIGAAVAGGVGAFISTKLIPEWNVSLNLAIQGARILDDWVSKANAWADRLSRIGFDTPGWVNDILNLRWPGAPEWMNPFTEWQWPSTPEWMDSFTSWSWPTTPGWMNPFTDWSFPQPPSWVRGLLNIFGGSGTRGQSQTRPVMSGTPDDQRDPTLARASRQNQAGQGGRGANVNNNVNVSLDPQRVARELVPEVERQVQQGLDDLRRELGREGARGSAPGARN